MHQAGVRADVGVRHQRIGGDVEADVLHRGEGANAGKRGAERHVERHLLVGRPFRIEFARRDSRRGSPGFRSTACRDKPRRPRTPASQAPRAIASLPISGRTSIAASGSTIRTRLVHRGLDTPTRCGLCANFTPPRNGISRRSERKTPHDNAFSPGSDPTAPERGRPIHPRRKLTSIKNNRRRRANASQTGRARRRKRAAESRRGAS